MKANRLEESQIVFGPSLRSRTRIVAVRGCLKHALDRARTTPNRANAALVFRISALQTRARMMAIVSRTQMLVGDVSVNLGGGNVAVT